MPTNTLPLAILLALAAGAMVLVIKLIIDHLVMRTQRRIWAHERAEAEREARRQAEQALRIAAFNRAYPRATRKARPVGPGLTPHPVHGPTHAPATTPSWVVPPACMHADPSPAPGIGDTGTPTTCSTSGD